MFRREIDGDGSAKRGSVDDDVVRREVSLLNQVLPGSFGVLIDRLFARKFARAFAISAVVDNEDWQSEPVEPRGLGRIVTQITAVAVQIEQHPSIGIAGGKPPSGELAVASGNREVIVSGAIMRWSDRQLFGGEEDQMCLPQP